MTVDLYPAEYRAALTHHLESIGDSCFDYRTLPLLVIGDEWRNPTEMRIWARSDVPHGVILDALRAVLRELEGA